VGDYDHLELQGSERKERVEQALRRIEKWGLKMPDVAPLPLHFGLDEFDKTGEIEFWIANETDSGYCGKFLFVFDGQTCPYHFHKRKHETFFVVRGSVRMRLGEGERVLAAGERLSMPPGLGHSFTGIGDALLLEVSMPTALEDSFFEDKRIGEEGVV